MNDSGSNPGGGSHGGTGFNPLSVLKELTRIFFVLDPQVGTFAKTVAYLVMIFLIAYVVLVGFSASFILPGELLVGGDVYDISDAKLYDVKYKQKKYAVNSEGEFRIPLTSSDYARYIADRTIDLKILGMGFPIHGKEITGRINGITNLSIERLVIPIDDGGFGGIGFNELPTSKIPFFNLVQPVLAQEIYPNLTTDRLFIESITVPPKILPLYSARLYLKAADMTEIELRSVLDPGAEENESEIVKLIPGETTLLGSKYGPKYYFDLPTEIPAEVTIRVVPPAMRKAINYGSDYNFTVESDSIGYNREYSVADENGITLVLRKYKRYDVVFFAPAQEFSGFRNIKSELESRGYRTIIQRLKSTRETSFNAVIASENVTNDAFRDVFAILANNAVELHNVSRTQLRSGNPFEIQFGGSPNFDNLPLISNDLLIQMSTIVEDSLFNQEFEQLGGH